MKWVCIKCGKPARLSEIGTAEVGAYREVDVEERADGRLAYSSGSIEVEDCGYPDYFQFDRFECAECGANATTLEDLVAPADARSVCCDRCDHGMGEHADPDPREIGNPTPPAFYTRGAMPCEQAGCDCHDFLAPLSADMLVRAA